MALTGIVIGGTTGTGSVSVGVPDVVNLPQADAESKLRQFDLVPRSQNIEADGVEGTVFSQNPAARSIRARGTVVTLLIVRAPVVPPNLGQQLSDLQASVDDLTTKVDGVVPAVQAVGTQVDGVGTKVDGVGSKVDAVSAKVDGVGTKVDGVGTKVDEVSGKLDTLATSVETDAAADGRNKAILAKLDDMGKVSGGGGPGKSSGASRSGA
jgi:outer membrane murein-binding lipoprotein Lpp